MPKTTITAEEHGELHEVLQAEYETAADGNFVLKLDGAPRGFVEAARLDEMRSGAKGHETKASELATQLEAYEGIDPVKARELLEAQEALDPGALIKAGDLASLVTKEVDKIATPLKAQVDELQATNTTLRAAADKAIVDTKVLSAGGDFGKIRKGAGSILVLKAQEAGWGNTDGTLTQRDSAGELISTDISTWIAEGAAPGGDLAFLYEPSTGGGSEGGEGGGDTGAGKTIDAADRKAFRNNLEDVASGKTRVTNLRQTA
jgi:hypothetical protein